MTISKTGFKRDLDPGPSWQELEIHLSYIVKQTRMKGPWKLGASVPGKYACAPKLFALIDTRRLQVCGSAGSLSRSTHFSVAGLCASISPWQRRWSMPVSQSEEGGKAQRFDSFF